MRRIVLWGLSTCSAVVLLFGYHTSTSGVSGTAGPGSVQPVTATGTASTPGSGAGSTVTGSVASTRWGPVQVELTIASGRITDVSVVQYPDGNGRDQEINDYALPVLVKETVAAQSADIDMVSGATVTSDGYVESLQSALDQANL